MNTKVALSLRTSGARQSREHQHTPLTAAITVWIRQSFTPFPSCRTHIGGTDPTPWVLLHHHGSSEQRTKRRGSCHWRLSAVRCFGAG